MAGNVTYSFLNVSASLAGPGGLIQLGAGAANAKEGIRINFIENKNKMDIGADGGGMHSLHAGKGGQISVTLLKTSPVNNQLSTMYNFQTASSATHGINVVTVTDPVRGDLYVCTQVAFQKFPDNAWAEDGNMIEWRFDAVSVQPVLGPGA